MKNLIVLLSDIHIGDDSPACWYQQSIHEPYLLSIFDWIVDHADEVREVVFLGDIVDMWTYPFNVQPPDFKTIIQKNPNVFSLTGGINKLLDALDGSVTYIPGNHDMSVVASDLARIVSPHGYRIRYARDIYNPAGDSRVVVTHGNDYAMFNAPDNTTKWAPLPIGYFITRIISSKKQEMSIKGVYDGELLFDGMPNGINKRAIIEEVLNSGEGVFTDLIIDAIAEKEGVSLSEPIILSDGTKTNLTEVKTVYSQLFSNWVIQNGGGEDGRMVATKAALADADAAYMGWFAQRQAFVSNAQLVVMGHTHVPVSGLKCSLINYMNSGFECPPLLDMSTKPISFAVIEMDSLNTQIMNVDYEMKKIKKYPAQSTSIVESSSQDYSCYVIIDNTQNSQNLTLFKSTVGHGHFVTLPQKIKTGSLAILWLQDYPGIHGSDADVVYKADDGTCYNFKFDCPTGLYPNTCSGGCGFIAKSGDDSWLSPGVVPKKGHPLFVHFMVIY